MKPDGRMVFKIGMVVVSAMMSLFAFAADTYTWIPGSTDWDSEDSYVEDGKPGQGDIVLIPSGKVATNKVVAGDAASLTNFEAFSKLSVVKLESKTSKLVLDIGEGVSLTNNCRITCNDGNRTGLIVKRGLGSLEFGVQNNASAYNCCLNVEEGLLALPQNMTASTCYLGDVVVSNGATLVTALDSAHGGSVGAGPTYAGSLNGGGDITNRYGGSKRLGLNVSYRTSTFSGRIRRGVMIFPSASGQSSVVLNLTGVESDTSSPVYVSDNTTLGAAKFGLMGQPSSIGKVGSLYWRGAGTFKYLGDGEDVTDKNFYTWTQSNAPITLDAGKGFLRMTGILGCDNSHISESYGMVRLTLTGEGVKTNVFAGTMSPWSYQGTNYCFHVTKRGTCVWRFADKAQTHSGAWTVADGTLQFESLKPRGVACSLGTALNCFESYTGLIDENKRALWAFALGSAATPATLEYVGTSNVICKTRPIILKGKGGTLKNSSDRSFVFGGISSAAGENVTLTLDGDATAATNELWNVTDGEGTTSLVKDGAGTWALCGTNYFSGSLAVKSGTLVVKNLSEFNYDWFRFTIKERAATSTESDKQNVRAVELGIYDAENKRMNGGLTTYANYGTKEAGSLPAGMAGYGHPNMPAENTSRPLSGLFEGGTSLWTQMGLPNGEPKIDDDTTWVSVIMHLTNTTARAKTFDVAQRGDAGAYRYKTFSMEGSLDGVHWDVLTNVTTSAAVSKWTFAASAVTADNAAVHTGGGLIAGGPEGTANALEGVSSVSVADGARLVAQGAATIPGLTIDATGAGTVEGFAFAENGTLVVKNMPRGGGALPGTYANCTGLENVANWTLSNGDTGRSLANWSVVVKDGVVTLLPPGAVVIIK